MKEEQKIYIRGSKDRPDDVRKILEQHGGRVEGTTPNFTFCDCIYYINRDGIIYYTIDDSELYRWVTEYYHEVKLPHSENWKAGDILVDNNDPNRFYVFSQFAESGEISIRLKVIKSPIGDNVISEINDLYTFIPYTPCHKADDKELKTFYNILAKNYLTWDTYNKKLLSGNYTYFYPKNGHYYFRRDTLRCKDRLTGEWYDAVLYSDANGQYVREVNDFTEKFNKVY